MITAILITKHLPLKTREWGEMMCNVRKKCMWLLSFFYTRKLIYSMNVQKNQYWLPATMLPYAPHPHRFYHGEESITEKKNASFSPITFLFMNRFHWYLVCNILCRVVMYLWNIITLSFLVSVKQGHHGEDISKDPN